MLLRRPALSVRKPPSERLSAHRQTSVPVAVWKRKLCGNSEKVTPLSALNIRDFIARDAVQDVAMASVAPAGILWEYNGAKNREEWCRSETPHPSGPEWYLRLRDRIMGGSR